jgi:hypothetical protein
MFCYPSETGTDRRCGSLIDRPTGQQFFETILSFFSRQNRLDNPLKVAMRCVARGPSGLKLLDIGLFGLLHYLRKDFLVKRKSLRLL